ncbi:MAG TPA: DUF5916 domain-containing protein [Opitutus sp.]|nr:DUF5916 domain-containing protein [Opitutus sp.]
MLQRFIRLFVGLGLGLVVAAAAESPRPKRTYDAARLTGEPPVVDGRLDDACWREGEWAGGYRQREPFEGAEPTAPTEIKILYDNRNLYVAIRAYDPEIAAQPRLLGQRDEFSGDMVGVTFDSYLNRRTGFEFDVTSGGSKLDLILKNDGSVDLSWNAVWDAKVGSEAGAWTAEFCIPLSQLRYSQAREQVWGLHAWRWIRRKQEESNWQVIPMDNQGFVRAFGELRGITDLPPSRRIEVLPYAVVKLESLEREPANPYRRGDTTGVTGGLDAKVGVSSDFTLDLTVNPDFGQVEADPSEINLTTVETFFAEKRPFCIEGKAMFDFGLDDDLPFYSRRIGAAPSLAPAGPGFVDLPAAVRILTAEKITGRTAGGFSLGALHALTSREDARITTADGVERRQLAEPQTHAIVVRAQNDFAGGDTLVGGIFTATLRAGNETKIAPLPRQAVTGGLDLTQYWNDRAYFFEARSLMTRIAGAPAAITGLMRDFVHNYQRPDADYLAVDPSARSLEGNAGHVRSGKGSGRWRFFGDVSWRSPGVDFNDLGYLATADFVRAAAQVEYFSAEPGAALRRRDVWLRATSTRDYGGEILEHELRLGTEFAGLNNWILSTDLRMQAERLDTRVLRGGPALQRPVRVPVWVYFQSDGGRSTQVKFNGGGSVAADGSHYWQVGPEVMHRFGDRLRVGVEVDYTENKAESMYAGQADAATATHYLMGRMEQRTLSSELRVQANFSPTLSLSYYAGPYASTGRFNRFKEVVAPRAARDDDRFAWIAAQKTADGYEATNGTETFSFADPDFHWRELKSNLVLRWEFRPGSAVYAVWSQHRADARDTGAFDGTGEYRRLLEAHPDNTLLVKVSYWFSI